MPVPTGVPTANLVAFYDFEDAHITHVGSRITAATDLSGNGWHLAKGTINGANEVGPLYASGAAAGLPGAQATGVGEPSGSSDEALIVGSVTGISRTNFLISAVVRPLIFVANTTSIIPISFGDASGAFGGFYDLELAANASQLIGRYQTDGGSADTTLAFPLNEVCIVTVEHIAGVSQMYRNGVAAPSTLAQSVGASGTNSIGVGAGVSPLAAGWATSDANEVLAAALYNAAIGDTNRTALEQTLGVKYKVPSYLPSPQNPTGPPSHAPRRRPPGALLRRMV